MINDSTLITHYVRLGYLWLLDAIGAKCKHCLFVCFCIAGLLDDLKH